MKNGLLDFLSFLYQLDIILIVLGCIGIVSVFHFIALFFRVLKPEVYTEEEQALLNKIKEN